MLHGFVKDELQGRLGTQYTCVGFSKGGGEEMRLDGMYYQKFVDVVAKCGDDVLGVVSIKYVMNNYRQNAHNYLEQQMGETANLRRANLVYGNLLCVTDPIPYKDRDGNLKRQERIDGASIEKYVKLRADHLHPHTPNEFALCVLKRDLEKEAILGLVDPADIPGTTPEHQRAMRNELGIGHFFEAMAMRIRLRRISP